MGMLWWLLVGHAVGDFVVQPEAMAYGKDPHRPTEQPRGFPPWQYWMTAHALVHGGVVTLITGSATLGVAEAAAHWTIDYGKCDGWYGFNTDQGLHMVCKLAWWFCC